MATFEVQGLITGLSPLLQSNPRHHHPSDPLEKLTAPVRSKRSKTEEDHVALARLGFIASGHWGKEGDVEIDNNGNVTFTGWGSPILPGDMLRASLSESSKALKNRMGAAFDRGVQVVDDFALQFDGPKDCNGMWDRGLFRNDGGSRNGGKLVWITRVCIPAGWQSQFNLLVDMIRGAGRYIGIGSWRPANGGRFGRFALDQFEATEVAL